MGTVGCPRSEQYAKRGISEYDRNNIWVKFGYKKREVVEGMKPSQVLRA